MNLSDLFSLTLKGRADETALEFQGSVFTFQDLDTRSNRWAHYLHSQGFEAGDRLAVYLPNCVELLIDVFVASVKAGIIFTPINVLYREREVSHILTDAEPRALLTNRDLSANVPDNATTWLLEDFAADIEAQAPDFSVHPSEGDAPAALVYTSGTTGRSKGATITHNNFAANAIALNTCWRMIPDDRMLLSLPLFHVHGLGNGLHTWLTTGYQVRLLDRFRKETILDEFLDFRPSVFFGVPTMYERLLAAPKETARDIGNRIRLFVSGSAPLPAATLERFRGLYGHTILERYGMSETMMNISNPYAGDRRAGSVGKPLPGISIRLVNPTATDASQEVGEGEIGEVLIKGPNVFSGYWRQPEATSQAFTPEGYFRSGDLAVRSSRRLLHAPRPQDRPHPLRRLQCLPARDRRVSLRATWCRRSRRYRCPRRHQRTSFPSLMWSRQPTQLDEEGLLTCCREQLAAFKAPRKIIHVRVLPRNALGKVQRHLLPKQ